jgi:SAM-dependent methyltransferase
VAEWFDWTARTGDPNDPESWRRMKEFLLSVQRVHRDHGFLSFVESLVRGKRVLDVGVVSHHRGASDREKWRHERIAAAASYCLGVDILAPEVEELRRRGFNVVVADATSDRDLGERFEVAFLGDVIEHVSRPVDLLAFALRHLLPGGIVLAATPNPFSRKFFDRFRRYGVPIVNLDHVGWITPTAAVELGRRAGLKLEAYHLVNRKPSSGRAGSLWTRFVAPIEYRFSAYLYEYRAIGQPAAG